MTTNGDGDGWTRCRRGHLHWGRFGAAGLLVADVEQAQAQVLMQRRSHLVAYGGTWAVPGGARNSGETFMEAALREAGEEAGISADDVAVLRHRAVEHGGWRYETGVAKLLRPVQLRGNWEGSVRWVPIDQVDRLSLHPGFRAMWPVLVRDIAAMTRNETAGGCAGNRIDH